MIHPEAVDGLLMFITRASRTGSALVADYFHRDVIDGKSPLKEAIALKQFVEHTGSRLMFSLEPEAVSDFFTQRGYHKLELVSTVTCKELYFKGKSSKRAVSPMLNFITAIVAPA
ncbi:MAG: hypothetical protein GY860_04875 [Desulfobacteraceae bacterium]|nr:hypothetical protein [Desulfobacteraceae bacterium]